MYYIVAYNDERQLPFSASGPWRDIDNPKNAIAKYASFSEADDVQRLLNKPFIKNKELREFVDYFSKWYDIKLGNNWNTEELINGLISRYEKIKGQEYID